MRKIVLLSCVSKKLPHPAVARELYVSPLFRFALAYAKSLRPDTIYVLSAKHGLVQLDQIIAPYDETLNTKSDADIREWAATVLRQLAIATDVEKDTFIFIAGEKYRRHLVPSLTCRSRFEDWGSADNYSS